MQSYELMPGDVALAYAGDELKTLLGSCVSVILTDPKRTVAAMCHIVHTGTPSRTQLHDSTYGEVALQVMGDLLRKAGLNPSMCHAFVYGGGNMFPAMAHGPSHVGARNVAWIQQVLADAGVVLVHTSLGGTAYRKVSWIVGQGMPRVDEENIDRELT
nr:chemotaxis protein CheD [uncultured Rhodoferax sp.]